MVRWTVSPRQMSIGITVCVVLALLAGVAVFAARGDGSTPQAPGPQRTATEAAGSVPEDSGSIDSRLPVEGETGTLRLRLLRDGSPAPGSVSWLSAESAPWLFSQLAAVPSVAREGAPIQHVAHDGTLSLPIPEGHSTWLRATAAGPPTSTRFVRVPPFDGVLEQVVQLSDRERVLHVQVYCADYRTPAARAEVRVYAGQLDGSQTEDAPIARTTNDSGYVEFDGLAPGVFLLCAPGADPDAPPPRAMRVLLPPGFQPTALTCVLVAQDVRVPVALDVHAVFEPGGNPPPKLFLQRMDVEGGAVHPQSGVLAPGVQEVRFDLPPGTYRADVLPLGALRVDPATERIEVSSDRTRASVRIDAEPRRCDLKLVGIDRTQVPLRVTAQEVAGILDDRIEWGFLGRNHWPTAQLEVPVLSRPVRLVALGRFGSFISPATELCEGRLAVAMEPATRLTVRWFDWDPVADRDAVLDVDVAGQGFAAAFCSRVVERNGASRPALVAGLAVPQGDAVITCFRADGTEVWRRPVAANRHWLVVEVGADHP